MTISLRPDKRVPRAARRIENVRIFVHVKIVNFPELRCLRSPNSIPAIRLRARRREGQVEVWDDLRGIYLVLTPEEWVRRHLIAYLVSHCGVLPKRVVQEYAVPVNGQPQRADVVVVGDRAEPLVLAECKAPEIRIGERTLAQAVRYNSVLGARFVILTNGLRHYCCEYRDGKYVQLSGFPDFSAL